MEVGPTGPTASRKVSKKEVQRREARRIFRFASKSVHLTYKSHFAHAELLRILVERFGETKWYTVCSESGKDGGYDHTHFAAEFIRKIDTSDARAFDVSDVHPNVKRIESLVHKKRIWEYHEKEGNFTRSESAPFATGGVLKQIRAADSLEEAIQIAGITIRSVADVQAIRRDSRKRKAYQHSYPDTHWLIDELQPHESRCVYIRGPTNCGKTQWAIHQFVNPLVVRHIDRLGEFDPDIHDGIVFDDMSFGHIPREAAIYLVDWDEDSDIHVRYKTALIPRHTRKIFTSNKTFEENFPHDEHGAIRRRFSKIINCHGKVFSIPKKPVEDVREGGEDSEVGASVHQASGHSSGEPRSEEGPKGSQASGTGIIGDDSCLDLDWLLSDDCMNLIHSLSQDDSNQ